MTNSGKLFHLTLINTKNREYEKEAASVSASYTQIKDTFMLSLGESDDIGQLINILYRYDMERNIFCKL